MSDMMTFPATVEEFMEQYKIVDDEKVYTNGADLVPIFRMMQWFEHVSATDTISRQAAVDIAKYLIITINGYEQHNQAVNNYSAKIMQLPSAQPKQRTGKWILDRSGAYCCSECMEPCAGYVMMKPRDKFCKMCGAKMEV